MIHYFAYGSNLHPLRLMDRINSAELVGVVELRNHHLTFHKKSKDGSSKCNMFTTGCATDSVYGAIYEMEHSRKRVLDEFEGKGIGYIDNQIDLSLRGREYKCFTYLARQSHIVDNLKPYHWYKRLVVLGARYLKFPDSYIASIESVESMQDPDENRRKEQEALIGEIVSYR